MTTLLKIGSIQYLEIILGFDLVLLIGIFIRNDLRVWMFGSFFEIGKSYAIFLVLVFLVSLLGLQQSFNPANETFLKRPLLVTIARMAELFLDSFFMLYMANLFRENERLCIFAAKVYYWTGIAGGLYSIASLPLNYFFSMQLGTYNISHRFRGFDNEGGPYGTYLLSVCALTYVMYCQRWLSRKQFYWSISLLAFCLIGSQSKAAFFALIVISIFYLLIKLTGWRRWAVTATIATAFVVLGLVLNIPGQIGVYRRAIDSYQQLSNLRPEDANLVMGRVAGSILAPRMIAAHPLAGIGWGNYPLVRDDPAYRQGTAFSIGPTDAPGLGIIDYVVDLGIPLCLYLIWILFKPAYLLWRIRASPGLITMAAIQPIATLAGAHLNLVYPWIVVAFALGIGFMKRPNMPREVRRAEA